MNFYQDKFQEYCIETPDSKISENYNEEKILNVIGSEGGEEGQTIFQKTRIRMVRAFKQKKRNSKYSKTDSLKDKKGNNCQSLILYPTKITLRTKSYKRT